MKPVMAFVTLTCLTSSMAFAQLVEHRGIWLHPPQFKTPELCDQFVKRMVSARINVAYPLVWYWGGRAYYRSEISPMAEEVPEGFDPLGYLIEQCHKNGIQVHAWFVNGEYGRSNLSHVFSKHPDWRLMPQPGEYAWWYDLGKPEVREFEASVMLEVLKRYDVDGLHFDYIRYPGRFFCFCEHCTNEFKQLYGYDIRRLSGEKFPLSLAMSANPLDKPTTARVLVRVADGPPAVAINELGKGQVLLLNWHAENNRPPAVNILLKRFLEVRGVSFGSRVFLFTPELTIAKYGRESLARTSDWLRALGYKPEVIDEKRLTNLKPSQVVFLVTGYMTPDDVAEQLVKFVEAGGSVVVIDGPVFSIGKPSLQKLIGFSSTAPYFSGIRALIPIAESDLIPVGGEAISAEELERINLAWEKYRKDGVSELVKMLYERAKAIKPNVAISAAVFYRLASADAVFQDWSRWLHEGFIDYVLPMAYVMDERALSDALEEYKSIDPKLERIIPGLSLYMRDEKGVRARPPELVLKQVEICKSAGAKGVNFFALTYLSDEIILALSEGPFREPAKPYIPLTKGGGAK
jgi:uncharacterized lipoprotein YddW (UPF0748 family)